MFLIWLLARPISAFVDLVNTSNGNTHRGTDDGGLQTNNSTRKRTMKKKDKGSVSVVPAHFVLTDISGVKGETLIFANMMFCILDTISCLNMFYFHMRCSAFTCFIIELCDSNKLTKLYLGTLNF